MSNGQCTTNTAYSSSDITAQMICAADANKDSCQGDSGGPAVSYLMLPEVGETRATLMGLTSWG